VARPAYNYQHELERRVMLEANPWCLHCGAPANVADHQPPLSLHEHVPGSGCCVLVPSCTPCSRKQGGHLAQHLGGGARKPKPETPVPDVVGIPADDPVWDVGWLDDLREVSEDSTWPRFLTAPHPDAVGSYGERVEVSARRRGIELRWWQRLFVRMLLQHDAADELVYLSALLSTARQSGKTVGLREIGWWRLHAFDLFDQPQNVLHTARNFAPARDTLAPVLDYVDDSDDYLTRRMTNRLQLTRIEDMAAWTAIAFNAAYSMTSSLAIVDEAWDVPAAAVNEGIEPTLAEPASGQLLLVSTAHRRATALIPHRRVTLLQTLREPTTSMICEWSAPRSAEIKDRATWRMASPHWSRGRERLVEAALTRALAGEGDDPREPDPIESFRNQWLNQWPLTTSMDDHGAEVFLTVEEWAERVTTMSDHRFANAVIAAEDYQGLGFGAVVASATHEGVIVLQGDTFPTRSALLDWLSGSTVGVSALLAGVTLSELPAIRSLHVNVIPRGNIETTQSLPLLRTGVREGDILHVVGEQLDRQIEELRVRPTTGQRLGISSKSRNDLARCAAWAVHHLRTAAMPGVH
jgi:hypothetical protein